MMCHLHLRVTAQLVSGQQSCSCMITHSQDSCSRVPRIVIVSFSLGLCFKVGPITYISLIAVDQDLHLGLLESPPPFLSPLAVCLSKVYLSRPHTFISCVTSICVQVLSHDTCPVVLSTKSCITLSSLTPPIHLDLPSSSHIMTIGSSQFLKVTNYSYISRTPRNPKLPKSGYVCGGHNMCCHVMCTCMTSSQDYWYLYQFYQDSCNSVSEFIEEL